MKTVVKKILAAAAVVAIAAACVAVPWALKRESETSGNESAKRETRASSRFAVTLSDPLSESAYVCAACGEAMYSAFVEPTCLAEGFVACYCPGCETWEKRDEVAALGHDYSIEETVAPSCGKVGSTLHVCSRCGDSYEAEFTEPLSHEYTSSVVYPTCEMSGYLLYTCSHCGDSYVENVVDALGHDWAVEETEPTCEECGYRYEKCSRCEKTNLLETYDPLGHDWDREVVAATDEGYGYTIFTCSRCHAREIGEIVAKGSKTHDFRLFEVVEPTCEDEGYSIYRCAMDGCDERYEDDFVPALGHSYALYGMQVTRSYFFADVRCSRCGEAASDVSVTVSCKDGFYAFASSDADISGIVGECTLTVYAEGKKLFSLDLSLDEEQPKTDDEAQGEAEEPQEPVRAADAVVADGKLVVSYVEDGEERADLVAVYLVCGDDWVLTFPSDGEVDVFAYGFSGDIDVYLVTEDGETVFFETYPSYLFFSEKKTQGSEGEASLDAAEDGEEEGKGSSNGYIIAALAGVCVAAAALIAYLSYRRMKKPKAPSDGADEPEDEETRAEDDEDFEEAERKAEENEENDKTCENEENYEKEE